MRGGPGKGWGKSAGKIIATKPGLPRVFESGPEDEAIECRRHERGESARGGLSSQSLEEFGGPPPRKFLNFELFCVSF